jgi:hypothetical protein
MGVRCNTRGFKGDPHEAPFIVPYGDYEFTFVMSPVR